MINRFSKTTHVQQYVLNLIAKEQFSPGQRLPPEIQLAESIGASVVTIRRAMAELTARGIIERFQGKGTFVKRNGTRPAPLGTVAFLLANRSTVMYEQLIEQVRVSAQRRCHDLRVITAGERPDVTVTERLARVTGVVLTGEVDDGWVEFLETMHIPAVLVGTYELRKPAWTVRDDLNAAAALAVRRVHDRGCRHIGLVNGARTWLPTQEIHRGYRRALQELGLPYEETRVVWCRKAHRLADMGAFFASSGRHIDGLAVEKGCFASMQVFFYECEAIEARPVLGIIGDLEFLTEDTKRIVDVSFEQKLGETAVELLFEATAAGTEGPRTVSIPPVQ